MDITNKPASSFYESKHFPYYIASPDFSRNSSGPRMLHSLCHMLNELGYEAYITAKVISHWLRTPQLTPEIIAKHKATNRLPIAVYPEIAKGNILGAPVVARWILNQAGHIGGDEEFDPNELLFYWDKWTLKGHEVADRLFFPSVDTRIFNQLGSEDIERQGYCYYAHKYLHYGGKIAKRIADGGISLCQDIPRTTEEIVAILRRSKVLYCYEPSNMVAEANACGCQVILVDSEYMRRFNMEHFLHLERISEAKIDFSYTPNPSPPKCLADADRDETVISRAFDNFVKKTQAAAKTYAEIFQKTAFDFASFEAGSTDIKYSLEQKYSSYLAACEEKTREIKKKVTRLATSLDAPEAVQPENNFITIIVKTTKSTLHLLANTLDSLAANSALCWHLIVVSNAEEPPELDGIDRIYWISTDTQEEAKSRIDTTVAALGSTWVIELPSGTTINERLFEQLLSFNYLEASAVFFDDDVYDEQGKHHSPRFKPGVNPEALRSTDLAGPLCVLREVWFETGGAWQHGEAAWYCRLLRVAQTRGWLTIRHVPQILLSFAEGYRSNADACLFALDQHLQETAPEASISMINKDSWSVVHNLPSPPPSVDVFINSQGDLGLLERCLASLRDITDYPRFQVGLIIDNSDTDPDLDNWLEKFSVNNPEALVLRAQGNGFAASANKAISGSTADFSLFINDESVVIQKEWLDELVRACAQDGISGASPRLLKSGTKLLENTGHVLGLNGWRAPAFCGQANIKLPGQFDWIDCTRDITTLTSSCFIVRNSAVNLAGGMDAEKFSDQTAIADLSLRLFDSGQRLLYVPRANLAGSSELPAPLDGTLEVQMHYLFERKKNAESFQKRWWPRYANDPFWNPNLSLIENTPTPEIEYFADWFLGDEGKPKILTHVVANAQADFRVTSPLHALRKKNLVSTCVWKQRLFAAPRYHTVSELSRLNPDVHIVQNYIHDNALAAMNEWQKMRPRPFTIYALDDVITDIDPSNPFFKNFSANSRTRLKYALARCDRMVVSTDFLADLYQNLIADIRVVPNRLEMEKWLPLRSKKRTGKKPRIGWAGGTTHQRDLLLLKEVIEQTRDEADWIFFGMCPEEILPLIKESYPFVPFEDYPAFLASLNFDIAVAPLADTIFNRGKSNLRLLELGILGLPVICTDIDPYRDSPACRVDNTVNAWVSALRERIHDAEARETEGGTMRRWVTEKFLLENHLDDWLAAHMPN